MFKIFTYSNFCWHVIVLGPGEQYVRGSTGIASWKIICKREPSEEEQVEAGEGEEVAVVSGAAVEGSEDAAQSDAAAERLGKVEVHGENDPPDNSVEAGQDVGVAGDQVGGVTEEGEVVQGGEGSDRGGGEEGGGREALEHSSSPAVLEVTSEEVVNMGEVAGDMVHEV